MMYAPPADDISETDFQSLLAEYPAVAEAISESKGVKPGQKTLQQLDAYRYDEALRTFAVEEPPGMTLAEVKNLVEWKLRHGKFRPTLMSLVTSNDAQTTKAIISSAIKTYRASISRQAQQQTEQQQQQQNGNAAQKALDVLTKLRGIGPATASLLLSVHDPERAVFFSDEAYWWLCCGGKKDAPIRYSAKEYRLLCDRAGVLALRLGLAGGTRMVDVEKAAYVAMRGSGGSAAGMGRKSVKNGRGVKEEEEEETQTDKTAGMDNAAIDAGRTEHGDVRAQGGQVSRKNSQGSTKRKVMTKTDKDEEDTPPRRSKRLNRQDTR
ncbi:hypothetical protein E4U21_001494 [Claviceps maximensis]|nr:hypothetical protein E4U21_001494 [Claviceps maximensis]